jgi:hypothetical protein
MTPQTDLRDGMDADDALLRAARHAHAASLDRLSPRVQAQLAQRRRAAMQPRRSTGRGWAMIAAASTAVLALAIGVFVLRDDGAKAPQVADAGVTTTAPVASTAQPPAETRVADAATAAPVSIKTPDAAVQAQAVVPDALPDTLIAAEFDAVEAMEGATDDIGYGTFDETPDFYAWLGSEDALADVPESL